MAKHYWLVKSEPNVFSLDDLRKSPKQTTCWDNVRNYQARSMLRDGMQLGDGVLFYHSRVEPMAVVGCASVVRTGYPDPGQFDPRSDYHDPDSKPEAPRWYAVDLKFDRAFPEPVTLASMRQMRELEGMVLLKRGSRLSVQPVTAAQWKVICKAGGL